MTFNILAQCYTRSDFFPSVNPKAALKWKNRSPKIVGKLFILVYIYAYVYEPVHAYLPVHVPVPVPVTLAQLAKAKRQQSVDCAEAAGIHRLCSLSDNCDGLLTLFSFCQRKL
jgi:hypothetical protein